MGRAAAGLTSEVDGPACRHCYRGQNTRGHDTLMDVVAHPAEQPQERPSKGGEISVICATYVDRNKYYITLIESGKPGSRGL